MHNRLEKLSKFVLNSCIDPIGDQHDVHKFLIFVSILFMFGISGTVPTYGTAYVPTYGNAGSQPSTDNQWASGERQ